MALKKIEFKPKDLFDTVDEMITFILVEQEGLSYEELSKISGYSLKDIEKMHHKALDKFEKVILQKLDNYTTKYTC